MIQYSSCVYSMVIWSQRSPAVNFCILSARNIEFFVGTFRIAEKWVTSFDSDVLLEKWKHQDISCTTFSTYILQQATLQWACAWICFQSEYFLTPCPPSTVTVAAKYSRFSIRRDSVQVTSVHLPQPVDPVAVIRHPAVSSPLVYSTVHLMADDTDHQ
jgi:hypothetical protein